MAEARSVKGSSGRGPGVLWVPGRQLLVMKPGRRGLGGGVEEPFPAKDAKGG